MHIYFKDVRFPWVTLFILKMSGSRGSPVYFKDVRFPWVTLYILM